MNPMVQIEYLKQSSDLAKDVILDILNSKSDQETMRVALEVYSKSMSKSQDLASDLDLESCSGDSTVH